MQQTNLQAIHFFQETHSCPVFCAWVAAQDIDFRKNVDPLCAGLACDGTHVGVALTNLK